MKVRFWHSDKSRERILAEAFLAGVKAHDDLGEMRALGEEFTPDCDVAVMVGVKSRELWRQHTRAGITTVYCDKGYARHSRPDDLRGWEYWRTAVNGHQPTSKYRNNYPGDRLAAIGWKFQPWREGGTHIVIAGSSQKYHDFYGLPDPTAYSSKLCKMIHNYSRLEIVYRPKPSWKEAVEIHGTRWSRENEGIEDVLRGAHCMVTHGSNACFEAVMLGVPCVILGEAVAKPISTTDVCEIAAPRLASGKERQAWLRFLAYQQWTMAEFASGLAWKTIRSQIFE